MEAAHTEEQQERSSAEHITARYIALVRRKRDPEKERAVAALAAESLTLEEKIECMLEIDGERPFRSKLHLLHRLNKKTDGAGDSSEESAGRELVTEGLYTPYIVKERRRSIGITPHRAGFWSYLFYEWGRIRRFADEYDIVTCRLFPPRVRFSAHARDFFSTRVAVSAAALMPHLERIACEGWRIITKSDYNLLMEFRRLCSALVDAGKVLREDTGGDFAALLERAVAPYLLCHHDENYADAIPKAAAAVLIKLDAQRAGYVTMLIRELLFPATQGSSLALLITGLFTVKLRRLTIIDDLIDRSVIGVISNFRFDCPPDVAPAIDAHMNTLFERLATLIERRERTADLRGYIGYTVNKGADLSAFTEFLRLCDSKHAGTADTVAAAVTTAREILIRYTPFLCGDIILDGGSRAALFTQEIFKPEVDALRKSLDALEYHHVSFSKAPPAPGTPEKAPPGETTSQAVRTMAGTLYEIAERLARIYRYAEPSTETIPLPVTLSAFETPDIKLPYAEQQLAMQNIPAGRTVHETVQHLAKICYQAAFFFGDDRVVSLVDGEISIGDDIANVKKEIELIASPLQYRAIKNL
ncbi:MAG: hypothetical protein HZC28_13150 [Spirochaetes bacterium]|nr:hypothetical protein [Spirochaetota bacterium]